MRSLLAIYNRCPTLPERRREPTSLTLQHHQKTLMILNAKNIPHLLLRTKALSHDLSAPVLTCIIGKPIIFLVGPRRTHPAAECASRGEFAG